MSLYAIAFVAMLAAGGVFIAASLGKLESLRLLRVSAGLSVAAMVLAAASVLVTRRL